MPLSIVKGVITFNHNEILPLYVSKWFLTETIFVFLLISMVYEPGAKGKGDNSLGGVLQWPKRYI